MMEETIFEQNEAIGSLKEKVEQIRGEISKVIIGQPNMVDMLLIGLLSNGHILIEGVPGVAKTLASKLMAKVIKTGYSRIQFTPDLMPVDILGASIFNPEKKNFEFKSGPIFSNIILIDEINRAPAKTQSALFEVMEERQVTVDGITHKMKHPFMVLATQNPIEQEGTYKLPEAQLDRFLFKVVVGYPTQEEEVKILSNQKSLSTDDLLQSIHPVIDEEELEKYKTIANDVTVEEGVIQFIAAIVNATRMDSSLYLGASPRASLSILKAAKAKAAISGRGFVTPDDVKEMAVPVLRHRIIMTPEKEMEGISTDDIIHQVVERIEVPR